MDSLPSDVALLDRQHNLQAEAHRVLDELNLTAVLSQVGQPTIVGSLALGLMVWRDIDIEVQCESLGPEIAFESVRPVVSRSGMFRMTYHDFTGSRAIPELPVGYYWGLRYEPPGADVWKIDLWLLPAGTTRRTGGPLVESLSGRLTEETRLAILRLKDIWHRLPTYRGQVLSIDIYDAVLSYGIRTPQEFDGYLTERGKPGLLKAGPRT